MVGTAELKKDYKAGEVFNYFLCSDLHMESPDHDRALLKKELDWAVSENADILIGGDVFDMILSKDGKRYTPSRSKYGRTDAVINEALKETVEFLTPYAKHIKVMLCGNHETAVVKFHSFDPLQALVYELNKLPGVDIIYLGYQGFIRIKYKYAKGKSCHNYDIKAHHGTGGSAEITKGTITLNRFMTSNLADLYWNGHTHSKVLLPDEPMAYMNQRGNLEVRHRRGVITGAYVKPIEQGNPKDGYMVEYGDTKRTLQSTGGVMMRHEIIDVNNPPDVKFIC